MEWRLHLSDAGSNKSHMETNAVGETQWQEQVNSVKDEDNITDQEDPNGPKIGLEELKGPSGREGCATPRIQMVQKAWSPTSRKMMKKREPWDGV